jgi:pentatricopeptide repeat protein
VTDTSLWNALLEACKESGQFQKGYEHFEAMKAAGERPNLTTFNTMASLAAKGGNVSFIGVNCFPNFDKARAMSDCNQSRRPLDGRCGMADIIRRGFDNSDVRKVLLSVGFYRHHCAYFLPMAALLLCDPLEF